MKRVRLVRQTHEVSCGPACLAMLVGSTEQKMIELLDWRYDQGVDKKHMVWALKQSDVLASPTWFTDGQWHTERKALILFKYYHLFPNRPFNVYGHYIVWANKKYYDPSDGIRNELFYYKYSRDWMKVSGYLPVYE